MGGETPPERLYEIFFDMNTALCAKFPALDPFTVRGRRYHDVLMIFARLKNQAERRNGKTGAEDIPKGCIRMVNSKGEVTIMRPAKDDSSW